MTWNYRIIRTKIDKKKLAKQIRKYSDDYLFQIHEVYYEDGIIDNWTGPITPQGCDATEVTGDLILMLQAYNKPVLEVVKGELRKVDGK